MNANYLQKTSALTLLVLWLIIIISCRQPYKDGVYEGSSKAQYVKEPYIGTVKLEVKHGRIARVDFTITDTSKDELFDEKYEKHYTGNPLYVAQCQNDWKGVQAYPARLLKTQNIAGVDAVTGATWSYHIFRQSVHEALKKAQK